MFFSSRNPISPQSWRWEMMTPMNPFTHLQPPAPVVTSSSLASLVLFAVPPWGTCWGMNCGSSVPCDGAFLQTSAEASSGRARPLSQRWKKSAVLLRWPGLGPQPQPKTNHQLSKSLRRCSFQLSPASHHRILAPGIIKLQSIQLHEHKVHKEYKKNQSLMMNWKQ